MNGKPLSEAELARLYKLKAQDYTVMEIATAMGRKHNTILCRLKWDALTPEQRTERRKQKREWAKKRVARLDPNDTATFEPAIGRPTPEMLRDRDVRAVLPCRDLTAAFFGDPPLGLSALDGRR